MRLKIAVIGSGISGLGAAWALARRHHVTLYESDDRLGGHANTWQVEDRGRLVPVDTGFIVYNERNYPNLVRLFDGIGVATEPSDMSFSVSIDDGAFEYRARVLGLAAQPSNLLRPSFLRMVREIVRFTQQARSLIGAGIGESTGSWLERQGYSPAFRDDFLLPMVACIWSSKLHEMLNVPAATMAGFLDNHGLLDLGDRPQWRTVTGGSREYVRRVAASIDEIRPGTSIVSVTRQADSALVRDATGRTEGFDNVVLATHADTSLAILGDDATLDERRLLARFRYQKNLAVVHRDPAFMPRRRRAWSSWNYIARERRGEHGLAASESGSDVVLGDRGVSLTYWMNLLQNLETERPVFVTLNPLEAPVDQVASFTYHHPQYDRAAVEAQADLPLLQGARRTWFCGSYFGHGFHEDGLRSGLEVAASLGSPAPWACERTTGEPRRETDPALVGG
ncbi:MAG: FAD-dependent oxidoreductase [Actinobacteria bacterium]|nr:FAD-dependent oxidoreductase [Actinomycetota bacterium]